MDILIFGGQSNMQGQTECLPDAYEVKNAWEYLYKTDTLKTLCHPVGEDIDDLLLGAHQGYGSLVPAFCDAYIRERNTNVVAVHVAKGATVIADWAAESKRYACARRKILAAIHKTKTISRRRRFIIFGYKANRTRFPVPSVPLIWQRYYDIKKP